MATFAARLAVAERRYPPPAPALPTSSVALAERAGIAPDPWQRDVLTSSAPRMLLNVCRQAGKSTITATLAAYVALSRPGALVLCLSPSERQSGELLRKVVDVYAAIGRPVPADSERRLALELAGGSRVLALPGARDDTVRGLSAPALVLLDEAARISDALWHAVSPMVAVSGGRVVMLSTPYGKRGVFHQLWTQGGPTWERYELAAPDCPRISSAFLEAERTNLPRWAYEQEYLCRFSETVDSVFRFDDIHAALDPEVLPLWGAA